MATIDLVDSVNVLVDDEFDSSEVLGWLNDGLHDLAISVGATFPEITLENEPVIPDKFQIALKFYGAAMAKYKDSSAAEGDRFLARYDMLKKDFVSNYTVPDEYKESSDNESYESEYPPNPFPSYWRW